MQNSLYNPFKNAEMSKQNLNFNGIGKHALNLPYNQSSNIDLVLSDDCLLTGASIIIKDANFGDKFDVQVIDIDNVLGYGVNTILIQTITNWGVIADKQDQGVLEAGYPAKLRTGLYIRMIYTSTSTSVSPSVIINYHLHKVLC